MTIIGPAMVILINVRLSRSTLFFRFRTTKMDDVIDFLDESFEEISALDGSFVEVAVGVEEEAGPDTHTPSSSLQSCTMCDKKFKLKSSLKRHIRKKHDNAALHCSSCKITFNNNEDRKDHNINVHTKSHICENCGKKLLSKQ